MLLEAALRIQKQSSPKPKAQNKNVGFGIFGSIMKRLTQRNRNRKREIEGDGLRVSVKDILRWDSSVGRKKFTEDFKNVSEEMVGVEEKSASEMGFSCSCNGRLSSVWSESNEEKSLDMETSSSSQSEVSAEIIDFVSKERQNGDFASCEKDFCTSPFRFVLQRSPSSGRHTPNFSSPATSPSRHRSQVCSISILSLLLVLLSRLGERVGAQLVTHSGKVAQIGNANSATRLSELSVFELSAKQSLVLLRWPECRC